MGPSGVPTSVFLQDVAHNHKQNPDVEARSRERESEGHGRATTRGASARRRRHEAHRRHRVHHPRGDRGRRAGGPVRRGAGALPGRVRQPGNLGERLRLSLGLPEQGVLVRWRARRPRGGRGRDRDHVRDCLLRRRSRGHAWVGRRAGDEGTEAPRSKLPPREIRPATPESATIFFFPSASPARREPWTDPPALSPSPQAKKPCPHHESMSMEPALMFNRRFGPGFASSSTSSSTRRRRMADGRGPRLAGTPDPASPSRSVRGSASSATRGNR